MLEQFYHKEENLILFQMFEILCDHSHKGMLYSEICKLYNTKFASSKKRCAQQSVKLTNLDVAHYSKKLEKIGFVTSNNSNTAEKVICLRKMDKLQKNEALMKPDWQTIFP